MLQKEQSLEPKVSSAKVAGVSFRLRMYNILRKFLVGFILVSIINFIFSQFFYTPKVYSIYNENQEIIEKYKILEGRISAAQLMLEEIKYRDKFTYRSLFGADTSAIMNVDQLMYPETKYIDLQSDSYSSLMTLTWKSMDQFARMLYAQSTFLDELQHLASHKASLEAAIPAIWPIDRTKLKSRIGAFGMRKHPIYNRLIMHKGIDLQCDTGDPVYATGDAVVEKSDQGLKRSGYGQQLLLNHEYGYKTRYAHLSKRLVKVGDTVRRGDLIGEVGNTGGSTGAHLHYEVIHKGYVVNPISYFDPNMTNEEYIKLMEQQTDTEFETFE